MPITQSRRASFCLLLTALMGLTLCSQGALAGPVEPPLHLLFSDKNRLVIGTVKEINPPGRILFERQKVIGDHADVPELVDILAEASSVKSVEPGGRYVFAYTLIKRDKRAPGGVVFDKKGAMIISSLGLEPALFKDSRALQGILSAADTEARRDSRTLLDLMLKTLKSGDVQMRDLAAAQIALDADLGKMLNDRDRDLVHGAAKSPENSTAARSVLLQASFLHPAMYGDWWLPMAKEVLATTPIDGYPEGAWDPTGLVLLAFGLVEKPEIQLPGDSIARWLRSPQQIFREQSLVLLRSKFPGQERKLVEQALEDPALAAETREYLDDQLRSLNRQ